MSESALLENVKVLSEADGAVDVIIPSACLWDCVECFGEHRLNASFSYTSPNFVAHVGAATPQRVEETLRNWKLSRAMHRA